MNRRSKYGFFLAPDKGGGSGAGGATPAASTAGDANAGGIDLSKFYPGVDLENLDDSSRAALQAQAEQFATLQTAQQKAEEQARNFQSLHDKTVAELNRIKTSITGPDPQHRADPAAAAVAEIEQTMVASGVDPKAAKAQAPIMHKLLETQRANILAEVGRGVAPVTNMVMTHQAEQAFNYVRATDGTGAMAIPEVAQAVWNSCVEISREGTPVTQDTVNNLKAMHFMAHAEKNPAVFATLQMNAVGGHVPPPVPPAGSRVGTNISTGGYNYPGATFHAAVPNNGAPANGAKTVLDAGTKSALQSIFTNMKPDHVVQ